MLVRNSVGWLAGAGAGAGVATVAVVAGVVAVAGAVATAVVPLGLGTTVAAVPAGAAAVALPLQVGGMLLSADWHPIFRPSLPCGVAAAWAHASRVDLNADSYWDFIVGSIEARQLSIFLL